MHHILDGEGKHVRTDFDSGIMKLVLVFGGWGMFSYLCGFNITGCLSPAGWFTITLP